MPLINLLYCSEHHYDFDDRSVREQINTILLVSQQNNLEQSITGVLLVSPSSFVQKLEGERNEVLNLFYKIRHDKRHCNVILLSVQDIVERSYAAWPMACVQKTPSNADLFAPYIETDVFRPSRYESSSLYCLLNHLSERRLESRFALPAGSGPARFQSLCKVSLDVCDSSCNTRLFDTEDAAAAFIATLKRFYPASQFPYVILRDPNGTSQFLIKIMVPETEILNFQDSMMDL